jgi:hypothetical protein
MKRIVLEWGLILSVGLTVALSSLWAYSRFFDRSTYHLRISTPRSVGNVLHVLVGDGDLSLCDQFDVDASGNVRTLIVDSRTVRAADIRRGDRFGGLAIPGLDIRYYRMAPGGYLIWSMRLSLLIPVALLFLLAFSFRRRLKVLRGLQTVRGQRAG